MTPDEDTGSGWNEELSQLFIDYGRYFVPDRERQLQTLAGLLPPDEDPYALVDLCCGEGLLGELLLAQHPQAVLYGLDGSAEMLQRAQSRLAHFRPRFQAQPFDLFQRVWPELHLPLRGVFTSLAVHHLPGRKKAELYAEIFAHLAPGGMFAIADLIEPAHPRGWHIAAEEWDRAVRARALELDGDLAAADFFEAEHWNTYRYFDPEDIDQPSPLLDQLKWLEAAGFEAVDVYWMRAGHAIFGGWKGA